MPVLCEHCKILGGGGKFQNVSKTCRISKFKLDINNIYSKNWWDVSIAITPGQKG